MTKKFKCKQCSAAFESQNALSGHITGKHRNAEREWKCEKCGNVFSGPGPLGNHYKNAHGEADSKVPTTLPRKFFPCPECERTFTSTSGRKHHITVMHEMEPINGPRTPDPVPEVAKIDAALVHVPEEPEVPESTYEFPDPIEIVAAVNKQLWRDNAMPLHAVKPLLDWYDQTGMFIERLNDIVTAEA